eukprot:6586902-Alexandrium_andersonii.AAC.1
MEDAVEALHRAAPITRDMRIQDHAKYLASSWGLGRVAKAGARPSSSSRHVNSNGQASIWASSTTSGPTGSLPSPSSSSTCNSTGTRMRHSRRRQRPRSTSSRGLAR